MKIPLFLFLLLISTLTTHACTLCNSKTATAVRAAVFGPDLLLNIAVVLLPFAVCFLIVFIIYHGGFNKNNRV